MNDFTFDFLDAGKDTVQISGVKPEEPTEDEVLAALKQMGILPADVVAEEAGVKSNTGSPEGNRKYMLDIAESLVNGNRNVDYGDPIEDFRRTAGLWGHYLGQALEPHDVAAMMALLKISRIRWSPQKEDSWIDLAGYAACGFDCAMRENDDQD